MLNNDPAFRTVIYNLEKASTGAELRNALAKKLETTRRNDPGRHIMSSSNVSVDVNNQYSGALPTLQRSHAMNMSNIDRTWFDPFNPEPLYPGIPRIELPSIPDDCEQMDQDGNIIR